MSASSSIPPGLCCPSCDYDMTGLKDRRCPECGRSISDLDLTRIERQQDYARRWRWPLVWHAGVVLVGMVLTTWHLNRWMGGPGNILEAAYLAAILTGSVALGTLAVLVRRGAERRVMAVLWLRTSIVLYLPWLALAPMTRLGDTIYDLRTRTMTQFEAFDSGTWFKITEWLALGLLLLVSASLILWVLWTRAQAHRSGLPSAMRATLTLVLSSLVVSGLAGGAGFSLWAAIFAGV